MENTYRVNQLRLIDFKNYSNLEIQFDKAITGFCGHNGAGKTNLLDAIYYLCTTKSYFSSSEQYNFRQSTSGTSLHAEFVKGDRAYEVHIKAQKGQKKEITVNRIKENSSAEYVGKFPVVMIAPNDNMIILGGSDERRKLIDNILCQSDYRYTELLMQYNKVLANRNALLKQMVETKFSQEELLDTLDRILSDFGEQIFVRRCAFFKDFSEEFEKLYQELSSNQELVSMEYKSHLLNGHLYTQLVNNRERDIILQRTTAGVHLDDIILNLNQQPVKKVGSQGQQKSFLVAMKLALYFLLSKYKGFLPILLLDDIFDKFDELRVGQLFSIIHKSQIGQVFVTHTDVDKMKKSLLQSGNDFDIFKIKESHVIERI